MQKHSWKTIRDAIEADIADGRLQPGDRLPTEPELVAQFEAGRHSVRRAVAELAKEGKLSVQQGRGTFIESAPHLTYAIGKRTRLRSNMNAQASDVSGELLGAERVAASPRVAEALNLAPGAPVLESRRITFADGTPIAFGSVFHDVARFPDFVERRSVLGSATETYKSYGIGDYLRGETTLHSRQARAEEAKLLRQHPDLPVIVIRAIDTLLDGSPISFSQVIWSASRVKFTMSGGDQ